MLYGSSPHAARFTIVPSVLFECPYAQDYCMYPTVIPVGDEASSGEAKKEESLLKYSLPSSRISSQINVSLCGALQ